jgi:hypothetical protein
MLFDVKRRCTYEPSIGSDFPRDEPRVRQFAESDANVVGRFSEVEWTVRQVKLNFNFGIP